MVDTLLGSKDPEVIKTDTIFLTEFTFSLVVEGSKQDNIYVMSDDDICCVKINQLTS